MLYVVHAYLQSHTLRRRPIIKCARDSSRPFAKAERSDAIGVTEGYNAVPCHHEHAGKASSGPLHQAPHCQQRKNNSNRNHTEIRQQNNEIRLNVKIRATRAVTRSRYDIDIVHRDAVSAYAGSAVATGSTT